MKILLSRVTWGVLLILGGVLLLLQSLGVISWGDIFWAFLLGLGGIIFMSIFFTERSNWWALFPGVILLVIALVLTLDILFIDFENDVMGSAVLGSIGLCFLIVYLLNRSLWWAIIPTGVLLTLAVVVLFEPLGSENVTGGIFFLGLGLTFSAVALLPLPEGKMKWAWIPAGILGLMGFIVLATVENLFNFIWPIALIIVGGLIVYRVLRKG